jgi:ubiquinone/menaquinone biosynthesis C-methylase UbiE
MSSPVSNKDLYNGAEFSTWLETDKISSVEKYLIQTYLKPELKTVEAGTNGGRILWNIQTMGFRDLSGFDYVPALIDRAIARDPDRKIDFQVQDAVSLAYGDESFDQIIYLQQIICLIEAEGDRLKAIQESYRILKPGGIGLFSFLSFDSRRSRLFYSIYLTYLRLVRNLRRDDLSIQYLPWLKLGGKFNPNALFDRPPYTYWYRVAEIYAILTSVGFEIVGLGTDLQLNECKLVTTDLDLMAAPMSGMLYFAVKKPSSNFTN